MNLMNTSRIYQTALEGAFEIHLVHNKNVSSLYQNISLYRKALLQNDPDSGEEIFRLLNSVRFHFAMVPVAPGLTEFGVDAIVSELESVCSVTADANERRLLENVCLEARRMEQWTAEDNPLLKRAIEVAGQQDNTLLHTISRYRTSLTSEIEQLFGNGHWRVTEENSLKSLRGMTGSLIVFGHPMFQESQEFRLSSGNVPRFMRDPVADKTLVVMYADQGEPATVEGLLSADIPWVRSIIHIRDSETEVLENVSEVLETSEDDLAYLQYRISRNTREVGTAGLDLSGEEIVAARMVLLRNGRFVMKDFSGGAHQFIVQKRRDSVECRSVTVDSIQAGSWIIERGAHADSGMIESVANSRFEATKHRKIQHEWKAAVRGAIRAHGTSKLAKMLLANGVRVIPQSIKHWGHDPHSIGPESFERVVAMCEILELPNPKKIWHAMEKLRIAHGLAGHAIRDDLVEMVREKFDTIRLEVETEGKSTVHLIGCGELGIYLVEDVAPGTLQVSISELNHVKSEIPMGSN